MIVVLQLKKGKKIHLNAKDGNTQKRKEKKQRPII